MHGLIRRQNLDGSNIEIVARGVRNSVGFDWHPQTKELWFTDNGRDWAGDDGSEEELNRVAKANDRGILRLPLLPRQRPSRSRHQAAQPLRRRDLAGSDARSARGSARHALLHGQHVPGLLQEHGLHRPPGFVEPHEEVRL